MDCNPEKTAGLITHSEAGTIPGLFARRAAKSPEAVAYCEFDEERKLWREFTWAEMARRVDHSRALLAREGLKPRDRIGLFLRNGVDWVAFDIASLASGLVTVPLYLHDSGASTASILKDAQCRLLVVDRLEHWQSLAAEIDPGSGLEAVLINEDVPDEVLERANSGPRVISIGPDTTGPAIAPISCSCEANELATLIYTSGTTGEPKGVMLSHKAILWNAEAVTHFISPLPSDVFLSLLPLAHAFERTLGYYLPMMVGARVCYARSPDTLGEDFASVRPTVFLGVPRLYERVVARIRSQARSNLVKLWLLNLTEAIGWQRFQSSRGRAPAPAPNILRRWLWPVLDWLVAARIKKAFGGRLRIAVSGGAPLDGGVARLLCGIGLPLVEGYGLTEAAPVVTATTFEDSFPGSVGRALRGVKLKIGPKDELFVQTPSRMLGYWNNVQATSEAVDRLGWLKTGDTAMIKDGRVFITGRLKELITLSTGENVAAGNVEAVVAQDPLFDQVCVVGDGRPCLVAIVVIGREAWLDLAARTGLDPSQPNAAPAISKLLERIAKRTAHLSRSAQIRDVIVAAEPWTVRNGRLTPTLKIKRRAIEKCNSVEIAAAYAKRSKSCLPEVLHG